MIDKEPLELSNDFKNTLDLLEKTKKNLFITGRAGTGKSTLLKLFRRTTRKKTVVLAPTGIAALNVQGQTIHSFFGFPAKPLTRRDIKKRKSRKVYQNLEMLIIDEISMVRADLLDSIDFFLRLNRDNVIDPFGGVQVVFFGDLFQLPPVVSSDVEAMLFKLYYESPYFFSAKIFDTDFELEMMELRKTYRQKSRHFLRLLDAVRTNQLDYDDLEDLNERHLPEFEPEDFYITLSTRNSIVDQINERQLRKLASEEYSFMASVTGNFNPRLFPTELELKLKLGAQVMFVKNDPKRQFVNGTIGKIVKLTDDLIMVLVETPDGKEKFIEVDKMEWEIKKYKASEKDQKEIESETVGTFKQYPLRLAWAITIHKSQGKTFDKVIIHLGSGAFEHGQTYVALSRCRTLEGIVLRQAIRPRDIMVDERIIEFYEQQF
ncbi:MAG: ATP-dependent RecD-like DNA helicase [Saprospiraceae bacterium]